MLQISRTVLRAALIAGLFAALPVAGLTIDPASAHEFKAGALTLKHP